MEKSITELYKKQISLSEWFEQIGHARTADLREEDTTKRDRLAVLHEQIGLPFDQPTRFTARQIADSEASFANYLARHGDEHCAMRLLPQDKNLPKLRMRGHTVRDVVREWFPAQAIATDKYLVEFVPHPAQHHWSTIFVVNQHGIWGEIIADSHQALTQGFYEGAKPIHFAYDFLTWTLTPGNDEACEHLKEVIEYLRVSDGSVRWHLTRELDASFVNHYLQGYFETVKSEFGTWFIDYNQSLGQMYSDFVMPSQGGLDGFTGVGVSPGCAQGRVRIVTDPAGVSLEAGDVLVCDMTSPDYIHLMQAAGAIVTDRGGILCHAVIIARELGKPCIVGTAVGTKVLKDGDLVEVDATKGVVRKVEK